MCLAYCNTGTCMCGFKRARVIFTQFFFHTCKSSLNSLMTRTSQLVVLLVVLLLDLAFGRPRLRKRDMRHKVQMLEQEAPSASKTAGAAAVGGASFIVSGMCRERWVPPGAAYRPLWRPMFSLKQRGSLAAVAGCAFYITVGTLVTGENVGADKLRSLGRLQVQLEGQAGSWWRSARTWRARRAREREAERRREWLRANTKQAKIFVPSQ